MHLRKIKILLTIILLNLTIVSQGQEILWDSSFVVQDISFKVIAGKTDERNYAKIIRNKIDTATIEGVNGGIEVRCFNSDDYPDILLTYINNVPVNDLYLFDSSMQHYHEIKGMQEFPEAKRLKDKENLYYSYQRAGCADMNWISHLFTIEKDQIILLGTIHGKGCEDEEGGRQIEISKLVNLENLDKVSLVETLPIDIMFDFEDYKWGFIREYWNHNFEKFEK